jgi:DNA-binding transcriptional regulator YdaS (Cro superfamily)
MGSNRQAAKEALQRAIALAGGSSELAAKLGVSSSAPGNWLRRGSIPVEQCVEIELATKGRIKREQLRPDIFGRLRDIRAARDSACGNATR